MSDPIRRPRTLVLPPAPYAAALLGGWWLNRHWTMPLDLGAETRPLGWLAVGIGLTLFVWTSWTLWRHHTTVNPYKAASSLCTSGPFRFSRNPIYVGDWFILLGASLLLGTAWPLLFTPLIWLMLRYGVISHEEAHLEARFGDAYRDYKCRVRRWL